MTIQPGDKIPAVKIMQATAEGPREVDTGELFAGKTAVLFGVPGAFTPTCSAKHLPGFVQQAEALKAKGVELIACMAVNDAFVMAAWAKDQGITDEVVMLADGSAAFTKALGLEMDLTARGLGVRSQRFALVVKDGAVTHIGVEAAGGFEVSKAESILAVL
jgi:peroxiredoxin